MTAAIALISFISSCQSLLECLTVRHRSKLMPPVIVFALLPVSPNTATWASPSDKSALARRTGVDHTPARAHFNRAQCVESLTDPITWLLFTLMVVQCLIWSGFTTFSGLIINRGLGFSVNTSQLLGMPLAFEIICLYFLVA